MKNKINLFWFKLNKGNGNFGDELNPYIIQAISSSNIKHVDINFIQNRSFLTFKTLLYSLYVRKISFFDFFRYMYYNFISQPQILLAIGSVLHYKFLSKAVVWGAGIISENAKFNNSKFHAVRGKYTQRRIKELGYNAPEVLGDPALLMPLIYKSKVEIIYDVGIIPHYVHYDDLKYLNSNSVKVINLLDPIEIIVDQINSCRLTLSTSLHGIIVSQAYNIPSLWVDVANISHQKLAGDDIKFKDYFSSVEIEYYGPVPIDLNKINTDEILSEYKDYLNIKVDLIEIQKRLLCVAPFSLKNKFKNV